MQLYSEFSTEPDLHQVPGELFTADLVMAQRCSNNYVNNFHFKLHKHNTYISLEEQGKAMHSSASSLCTFSVEKGTHAKGFYKKAFIFSLLLATFVLALGLSACLGVTNM